MTYSGSIEKPHILESDGNGVLVLDYDGDGYQDLCFVAAFRIPRNEEAMEERSALYRNLGNGTFVEVSGQAGVGARVYGHGGCVGDYNADGLPDIYLTAYGDNILYRNNGDGTFTDVTEETGVAEPAWSIGAHSSTPMVTATRTSMSATTSSLHGKRSWRLVYVMLAGKG